MSPSPGSVAVPAAPPPHSTSTRRLLPSEPPAAPARSTVEGDVVSNENEHDDELVLHAAEPPTWIQQGGARAGGRRRSSSLAQPPRLNGGIKRSSSDWREERGEVLRRRGAEASTSTSSSDGGGEEERRDELSGLGSATRPRSRTSSFTNGARRRDLPPSSLSASRSSFGAVVVNGHDHLHAHFAAEPAPFSRPPSTAPRPKTASRPSSTSTQRLSSRSRTESGSLDAAEGEEQAAARDDTVAARDVKGKGKAREPRQEPAPFDSPSPSANDPLDPLFALSQSPSYGPFAPFGASPSFASSLYSASRPGAGIVRPQGPPPPALRPPDPFPSPSPLSPPPPLSSNSDHHRYPPSYPSTESLASSAAPSSSAASFPSASTSSARQAHQPSLQQLLQTVDLGAALKLVQTLQTQQAQQARLATISAGTAANSAVPAANATIEPVSPLGAGARGSMGGGAGPGLAGSATVIDFADLPSSPSPRTPTAFPSSPLGPRSSDAPPSPALSEGSKPAPASRRTSLIGGLQRRLRSGSSMGLADLGGSEHQAQGQAQAQAPAPARLTERQKEKRAAQLADEDDLARTFDDQISRVYLTLSPATLRRAQNCARYLSLRYTPLFAALSAPDHSIPLPNPLGVARWRVERDEAEKRSARQQASAGRNGGGSGAAASRFRYARAGSRSGLAGGGGPLGEDDWASAAGPTRLSTLGSVRSGAKPSPYGPRRNKTPKVWELYPDDISDYVAMGGKATMAEAAQALEGGARAGAAAEQPTSASDGPAPVREHKRGSMSIDELFPSSASGGGGGGGGGSVRASTAIAGTAAAAKGKEVDLSRIPTGASASTSTSAGAQPYLRNGNASARSLATTDGRSSPLPRPASPVSPPQRPFPPRQPSFEGAPFARSKHSFHSSDGVYPGSPLRRSTSLSTGPNGTAQPRSPIHPPSPLFGRDTVGLASDGSPYSRGGSALASRDDLPLSSSVGAGGASTTASRHRGSHSTTEALRSGISRRLDRIRGRTMDEASASVSALDSQAHDSPAQARSDSDHAARSPSRRPQPHLPSPGSGGEHGATTRRQFERPYLRKNNTSVDVTRPSGFDSDGPMRSSGDEALMGGGAAGGKAWRRASNRILQSAWQGFKTSLDTYPDPWGYPPSVRPTTSLYGSNGRGRLAASGTGGRDTDGALRRSQIAEADEEDDSEGEWAATRRRRRPPREVVDLNEDDYGRLNSALRQIRIEVARIDDTLPQQIATLGTSLDELSAHAKSTTADARLPSYYTSPRIPASVLADIAHVKRRRDLEEEDDEGSNGSGNDSDSEDSEPSSSSSTSSNSSSSRASSYGERGRGARSRASSPRKPSLHARRPRRDRHHVQAHARHVTEPVSARQQMRARSQTLAFPPNAESPHGILTPRPKEVSRASGFSPMQHAEPLRVLENVVRDLTRAADELDEGAREVAAEQDKVDAEINRLVKKVEATQKGIEETDYQKLRALEDHHLRLRTRLARPSPITSLVGPAGDMVAKAFFVVVRAAFLAAWPVHWVTPTLRALGLPLSYSLAVSALSIIALALVYYGLALRLWALLPDLPVVEPFKALAVNLWTRCSS
ncbi:hypothetical protein JCM8208_001093 [Rhodotorula glutinis]